MKSTQLVTISKKIPVYTKTGEKAEKIEVVKFEEFDFHVIAQKNLYEIGYKAVFILPDYCVSDIDIFRNFIAPDGDEKKSYLGKIDGKPRRIRAKKFNMSFDNEFFYPIYSNGILLPIDEVVSYFGNDYDVFNADLESDLGITKYEGSEDDENKFPEGVYKTDEDNFKVNYMNLKYPSCVYITEKVDGSSITIGVTPDRPEGFICSRSSEKPMTVTKIVGQRDKTLKEKLMFWTKPDLNIYEEQINDDVFVEHGLPILTKLLENGYTNIILRGELAGKSFKSSGSKINPYRELPNQVYIFGVDKWDEISKMAVRQEPFEVVKHCAKLGLNIAKSYGVFKAESKEGLEKYCNKIFQEEADKGRIIEGLVLRVFDKNYQFSSKYMNDEYDSKK